VSALHWCKLNQAVAAKERKDHIAPLPKHTLGTPFTRNAGLEPLGKRRKELGNAEGPQSRANGNERVHCREFNFTFAVM
jgi:hypothetical protein